MAQSKVKLFKLQASIYSTVGQNVLVYDKERKYTGEVAMTQELKKLFRGEPKIYVFGTWDSVTGQITVTDSTHQPHPGW
jgi:hypothetical protein